MNLNPKRTWQLTKGSSPPKFPQKINQYTALIQYTECFQIHIIHILFLYIIYVNIFLPIMSVVSSLVGSSTACLKVCTILTSSSTNILGWSFRGDQNSVPSYPSFLSWCNIAPGTVSALDFFFVLEMDIILWKVRYINHKSDGVKATNIINIKWQQMLQEITVGSNVWFPESTCRI